MVASKRLYDVLGVSTSATDDEIKRAYKKAALKWHPDRNQGEKAAEAEKKFKEVGEAYEVLGDKEKRRIYDQVGEGYKDMGGGGGGGGFPGGGAHTFRFSGGNPHDIFSQFFGSGFKPGQGRFDDDDPFSALFGGGGMGGMGGGMGGGMPGGMGGMGGMPFGFMGGMPGGMGGMGGMHGGMGGGMGGPPRQKPKGAAKEFPLDLTLEDLAKGITKKRKLTRKRNKGGRYVDEANIVEITVQPGWKAGTKVTFPGEGDELPHQAAGDIIFVVRELPHDHFVRVASSGDLTYRPRLQRGQAHEIAVPTLQGGTVTIRVPDGSNSTNVPEKGMPIRKSGKVIGYGDICIRPTWV